MKRVAATVASFGLLTGACGSGDELPYIEASCEVAGEAFDIGNLDMPNEVTAEAAGLAVAEVCLLATESGMPRLEEIDNLIDNQVVIFEKLPKDEHTDKFPFAPPEDTIGVFFAGEDETYLGALGGNPPEDSTRASYFPAHNTLIIYQERSNPVQLVEAIAHELAHGNSDLLLEQEYGENVRFQQGGDEAYGYDVGYRALWALVGIEKMSDYMESKFAMLNEVIEATADGSEDTNFVAPLIESITEQEMIELFGGVYDFTPEEASEMRATMGLMTFNMYLLATGDLDLWYDAMTEIHTNLWYRD